MARPRLLELSILELLGCCEVIRRSTLHLLPYHPVTINKTLREMMEKELIIMKEHGEKKHFLLTPKGKNTLRDISPERFKDHNFLPSNIRGKSWERLMLMADIKMMLEMADYGWDSHGRPSLEESMREFKVSTNWLYSSLEVKHFLSDSSDLAYQSARLCGILLTPDYPYHVYHTRNVAMEIHKETENKVRYALEHRVINRMKSYRTHSYGALIFGDKDMVSAKRILQNSLDGTVNRIRAMQKKFGKRRVGELLSADTFDNSHFIPLRKEAIPLLELHRIQDGLFTLEKTAKGWFEEAPEGTKYVYLASFELRRNAAMLSTLEYHLSNGPVWLICMDWQLMFWEEMVREHCPVEGYEFKVMTNEHIERVIQYLLDRQEVET